MTLTSELTAVPAVLPLELTSELEELRERARRFVDEELIPLEEEAERLGGRLPAETIAHLKRAGIEAAAERRPPLARIRRPGLVAGSSGRWSRSSSAARRTASSGTSRTPTTSGTTPRRSSASATSAPRFAASSRTPTRSPRRTPARTPPASARLAERTDAGFRISGEKWFVTTGDVAKVLIVMANVVDGDHRLPTLFLVESDAPGVEYVDDPGVHPQLSRGAPHDPVHGCRGGRGRRRRRRRRGRRAPAHVVHGGADRDRRPRRRRDVAPARRDRRLGDRSRSRATRRIFDFQGVSFPLADSAADAAAGRLLALTVAALADSGRRPQDRPQQGLDGEALRLARRAWRCADRCVQAFGGRGYMRSNVAERLLRELRVDRIWEGTSEIQRLIVARGLERRGVERMLH